MGYGQYGGNSRGKSNPLARIGTIGAAPKREVFPTGEIPHKWAHQTQSRARNAQGNLFFNGPTIYSYRESWPLARIYRKRGSRAKIVLTNSERYSNTTAMQQHNVNYAASHLLCIAVPFPVVDDTHPDHADNLKYLADVATEALAKAQRAMQVQSVSYCLTIARTAIDDTARYMKFFGIRRKAPAFPAIAWRDAQLRASRIENPDPVRDARKIKARILRQASQRAALQKEFDEYYSEVNTWNTAIEAIRASLPDAATYWREHGTWPSENTALDTGRPRYLNYKLSAKYRAAGFDLPDVADIRAHVDHVLLRVAGDQIVTSQGARIPVSDAPRLWALVEQCRLNGGRTFQGRHIKAGDYALTSIGADGTLTVGCHVIPHSELALMARTLNLEGAQS